MKLKDLVSIRTDKNCGLDSIPFSNQVKRFITIRFKSKRFHHSFSLVYCKEMDWSYPIPSTPEAKRWEKAAKSVKLEDWKQKIKEFNDEQL